MRDNRSISFMLTVLMLISVMFPALLIVSSVTEAEPVRAIYTDISPIKIDGDLELQSMVSAEGWPGSGSEIDPYIISNYRINGTGSEYCIKISDTREHLKIAANLIENTDVEGAYGIHILNSDNVTIHNNTMRNSDHGNIKVEYSNKTIIRNNRIEGGCEFSNIHLSGCEEATVAYNSLSGNVKKGLYSYSCNDLKILGNLIKDCEDIGIQLSSADRTLIKDNNISNCGLKGIEISHTSKTNIMENNTLTGNDIQVGNLKLCTITLNNTIDDLPVRHYSDVVMTGMDIPHSTSQFFLHNVTGFLLDELDYQLPYDLIHAGSSNNITLTNISIQEGSNPIFLEECSDVLISNCSFKDISESTIETTLVTRGHYTNNEFDNVSTGIRSWYDENISILQNNIGIRKNGLYLSSPAGFNVQNNDIIDLNFSLSGIIFFMPDNGEVSNNRINGFRRDAINLDHPENVVVHDNLILGLGDQRSTGLNISKASYTEAYDNQISGHNIGINVSQTNAHSTLSSNRIEDNHGTGILLFEAEEQIIDGNLVFNNSGFGILARESSNCLIVNNTLIENHGSLDSFSSLTIQAWDGADDNVWNGPGYGNYWADWTSPDTDSDGIVDSPYIVIGGGSFDHYPAATPIYTYLTAPTGTTISIERERIELGWAPPEMDLSGIIEGYAIYRSDEMDLTVRTGVSEDLFSFSDDTVQDGIEYSYVIKAINKYGEGRPSVPLMGTPDSSAPVVNITSPSDGVILPNGTFDLLWNITDNVEVTLIEISMDEFTWYDWGTNTSYPVTNLSEGGHQFFIRATDALGNNATSNISVVVDLSDPEVEFITPQNGTSTNAEIIHVEWLASDGITAIGATWIKVDDGEWIDTFGNDSANFTIADEGIHTISVRAIDLAGNIREETVEIKVDRTGPEVYITSPVNDLATISTAVRVQWVAFDTLSFITIFKVWRDEEEAVSYNAEDMQGFDHTISSIPTGHHTIYVSATDAAGNERIAFVDIIITEYNPGPTHILIKGRVLDELDAPIHNIEVTSTSGNETKTDSDGYFTLEVPRGQVILTFKKKGFVTRDMQVDASSNTTVLLGDLYQIKKEESDDVGFFQGIIENLYCQICCISMIVIPVLLMLLGVMARARSKSKKARRKRTRAFEE